ncbi:EGF-like domain-containing protein 2 isoform X2 [Babylonia areolata]|uniref:EGF-like domain-containing protein 2 isoform X2 n=1 Tax=Babylonia areolata TaxID=304850 RepID=UPI003FD05EB8
MAFGSIHLLVGLTVLTVWVTAQDTKPTQFDYDCRRTNVNCEQDQSECNITAGSCNCEAAVGYEGHDCGLETSKKTTCAENQCENNGVCLQDNACYCNSNTYGDKCENPRVMMLCTETEMFINVFPHGEFAGKIFLRKTDGTGKDTPECQLTAVNNELLIPDLTGLDFVKTVQGETPVLQGFFISQNHEGGACQSATQTDMEDRTDYLQQVIIEYNTMLVSSVDQIITFNCSVSKTAGDTPFASSNAMDVSLAGDDYQPVNVTDTIEPVLFEIVNPVTTSVITNNINLGDPLDLKFTLQTKSESESSNGSFTDFKVTSCRASNGQPPADENDTPGTEFLFEDCPKTGMEMLYRGLVRQETAEDGTKTTTVPLKAFRFVGTYDSVAFTCSIKLCTADNSAECVKNKCLGDPDTDGGDGEDTPVPPVTTDAPAESTAAPVETPGVRRRKRSIDEQQEEQKNLTRSIQVNSRGGSAQAGTGNDAESPKAEEEIDCMQRSEVVIIIVIFVVILCLLVVVVVVMVVSLLRSRQKVVSASDMSTVDTQSRYSLPRLSLATTM